MKKLLILFISFTFVYEIQAQVNVKGRVTDSEGNGIPFVGIGIKGGTSGTTANEEGFYSITVKDINSWLIFNSVNYTNKEEEVGNRSVINVSLDLAATNLDEVVVVAYGTIKKTSFTGSAATIKSDVMKDLPVSSFDRALQGSSPGLLVSSSTGQAGANQTIHIRGIGSINASSQPLFVIDGVPMISGNISESGVSGSSGSLGVLNTINPNDIESLTILKDAAAAALYGSRGANGVILITTKTGKQGDVKINVKSNWGFTDWAINNQPIMSGDDLRMLSKESYLNYLIETNKGNEADAQQYVDEKMPIPKGGYSNWEKALFNDYGKVEYYEISASGGNKSTKFFTSLGYRNEEGKTITSWFKQYNGRANLTHTASKFSMGINIAISKLDQRYSQEGTSYSNPYFATRNYLFPTMPIYNDDGSYYTGPLLNGKPNLVKDMGLDYSGNNLFSSNNSIWIDYDLYKGIRLKQTISYDYKSNLTMVNWPSNSNNGAVAKGLTIKKNPIYETLYSSTLLTYRKSFKNKHHTDALVGWDVDKKTTNRLHLVGQGFSSPNLIELSNAATPKTAFSERTDNRMLSFLSRLNYNYDEKYYTSFTFRRDGSSRLGINKRWGNFMSISGAWNIKKEEFLVDQKWINQLKVRTSYGTSGNLPSSLYGALATYSFSGAYAGTSASYPSRIPNENLGWEKNKILDIGLEFRIIDRLSVEFDYYNRITSDLLLDVPISFTTGFDTVLKNEGKMQNRGIELSISYDVISNKSFKWITGLVLAHNQNKILKLYGGQDIWNSNDQSLSQIRKEGYAYNTYYSREFAGINTETGAEQWYTNKVLADGSIERIITEDATKAFRTTLGKVDPFITGGFSNSVSWKGLQLSAQVSFSIGGKFYNGAWTTESNGTYDFSTLPTISQLDRWQKPGDNSAVGKRVYNYRFGNYGSSKWIKSSTHARLKNISLAYSIPATVLKNVKINQARIYMSGTNLLTLAKTKNFDPEVPADGYVAYSMPALKTITFGVELSF